MCELDDWLTGGLWEAEPDPYDRPDFDAVWPQEETPDCDLPLAPCAVCGLDTIPEDGMAHCCPVCGWQTDPAMQEDWQPSSVNDGLSLEEARLNFRAFGWSNPAMLIQGEE